MGKSNNKSKIKLYNLQDEVLNLRKKGYSLEKIAEMVSVNPKVPEDDIIDRHVIRRFLENYPDLKSNIVEVGKEKFIKNYVQNIDVVQDINELFYKAKNLLRGMEQQAADNGRLLDPYKFKIIAEVMSRLLDQMIGIQKEVNDYNNVRKFMEIVLTVLKEEAPEAIPAIIERLKIVQGTRWFSEMMKR